MTSSLEEPGQLVNSSSSSWRSWIRLDRPEDVNWEQPESDISDETKQEVNSTIIRMTMKMIIILPATERMWRFRILWLWRQRWLLYKDDNDNDSYDDNDDFTGNWETVKVSHSMTMTITTKMTRSMKITMMMMTMKIMISPATERMWRFLIPQMCWRPKSRIWVHHLAKIVDLDDEEGYTSDGDDGCECVEKSP